MSRLGSLSSMASPCDAIQMPPPPDLSPAVLHQNAGATLPPARSLATLYAMIQPLAPPPSPPEAPKMIAFWPAPFLQRLSAVRMICFPFPTSKNLVLARLTEL